MLRGLSELMICGLWVLTVTNDSAELKDPQGEVVDRGDC